MKIYIVGKWQDRQNVKETMNRLTGMGHEITCNWTDHEFDKSGVIGDQSKFAQEDLNGILSCDILIALMTEGYHHKGGLCEIGAALVLNKKVYVLGNAVDSCIFLNHPLAIKVCTIAEIFAGERRQRDDLHSESLQPQE